VREARKLRSSHENIELLKEKLFEEKGWRERAESELSKLLEFELNMKKLEDELSSWKSVIKDIPGVLCYDDIPAKFAALQKYVYFFSLLLGIASLLLNVASMWNIDTQLFDFSFSFIKFLLAEGVWWCKFKCLLVLPVLRKVSLLIGNYPLSLTKSMM
jgi:hypothetical protein